MTLKLYLYGSYILVSNSRSRAAAKFYFVDKNYATEEDGCHDLTCQEFNETKLLVASVVVY